MQFEIINDGASAGLTYDINQSFATQMAQMPLRNDVVKTITIENPGAALVTAVPIVSKPKIKVNSGYVEVGGENEAWLTAMYTKYPFLTDGILEAASKKFNGYSNQLELTEQELAKMFPGLQHAPPIDPSKPKNATADVDPNTPTDAAKKPNWLLIGGIGLGVAALAAVVIIKRKKRKAKLNGLGCAVNNKPLSGVKRTQKRKPKTVKKSGHKAVAI